MLTPAEIEERHRRNDEEHRLEDIAAGEVCPECGHGLITPWNPDKNCLELRCGKDKTHQGHVRLDPELDRLFRMRKSMIKRREPTPFIDAEIQQLQIKQQSRKGRNTMVDETHLEAYRQTGVMTKEQATEIIRTTPGWGKAPVTVVQRAAMMCRDYRLYPGIHIYLIPFRNKKTGQDDWAIVQGIKTTRLLASRRKAYSYVDGPRVATEEEVKRKYGKTFPDRIDALCTLKGLDGSVATGWGWWPAKEDPYGTDKGNTKENMVFIRAERQALEKLMPGEIPTGVELIDESYIVPGDTPIIREVVEETGEIIEGEKVEPSEAATTELHQRPSELLTGDAYVPPTNGLPKAEEEKTKSPETQPAKVKQDSRMMEKDPTKFIPKNQADLVGGARYYWSLEPDVVAAKLGGALPASPKSVADGWHVLLNQMVKGDQNDG